MKAILSLIVVVVFSMSSQAQVGIGTATPEAALDIFSLNSGLLIPRIALGSTSDVSAFGGNGTESELIYNTTLASGFTDVSPGFYYLSSASGPWVRLGSTSSTPPPPPPPPVSEGWLATGNVANSADFLGTLNAIDLVFRRNDVEAGRLSTNNTSFGVGALQTNNANAWNTAFGTNALGSITSGTNNVAIGHLALEVVTSGSQNVAIGFTALSKSLGEENVAVGYQALWSLLESGARGNVAIGHQAMDFAANLAGRNVAIGQLALRNAGRSSINGGTRNIAIGYNAGSVINAGSNNIIIGYEAQPSGAGATNEIVVGGGGVGSQTAFVNTPLGWANSSDRRLKANIKDSPLGLDFIKTIRPVAYYRKNDTKQKTEFGFIAQELETALNTAGFGDTGIVIKTTNDILAVHYNAFLPMTVKAVQEQQTQIEALQKQNAELMKTNAAILKRLEALEKK